MKRLEVLHEKLSMFFRNRVVSRAEVGSYRIEFRRYEVRVQTRAGQFKMRLRGDFYPSGYLTAAHNQGLDHQLEGYSTLMFMLADGLCRDKKLVSSVTRALEAHIARVEKVVMEKRKEDPEADAVILDGMRSLLKKDVNEIKEVLKDGK